MKLSDMTFDDMMNVVSAIAVEAEPLLKDPEIAGMASDFKRHEKESDADYERRVSRQMFTNLALLSGKYRPALHRILGALFQCAPEEVAKKNVNEIAAQVKDSLEDEVLHGFFPQLKQLAHRG